MGLRVETTTNTGENKMKKTQKFDSEKFVRDVEKMVSGMILTDIIKNKR